MRTRRRSVAVLALCFLFTSVWVLPDVGASEGSRRPRPQPAEMTLGTSRIDWQPAVEYERAVLTVAGPGDLFIRRELDAGQTPSLALAMGDGGLLPDGIYTYELRFLPGTGRSPGQPQVLSGYFSVRGGSFVTPAPGEPGADAPPSSRVDRVTAELQAGDPDLEVPGDLFVLSGACIGERCDANENQDDGLLRLHGSITRIVFDDPPDGFTAAHSWELRANAPLGSGEYFTLLDLETSLRPFTVEGDAPANALYVNADGDLGLGTATPAEDVHALSGNAPTLRLEQDGSGGLASRSWDLGGNHNGLWVKDVTSSRVPFTLAAGAPTNALYVDVDGDLGLGTATPARDIHAVSGNAPALRLQQDGSEGLTPRTWDLGGNHNGLWVKDVTSSSLPFRVKPSAPTDALVVASSGVGVNCSDPASDLVIASGAGCSTPMSSLNAGSSSFTVSSSRTIKENLSTVQVPGLLDKIARVGVFTFDFIDGPKDRLGLMAEDFHQIFERGTDKLIDGQEVQMALWLAVQELTGANRELRDENLEIRKRLADLESLLEVATPAAPEQAAGAAPRLQ